jgi:hypothetical protein
VSNWDNKTISLNDCWLAAAQTILRSANGGRPTFTLLPYPPGSTNGAAYVVQVTDGDMVPGWDNVVFAATGTIPFTGLSGLPPWSPGSVAAQYRQAIANTNCGNSGTQCLEGIVSFTEADGTIANDRVRLFYAAGVVMGPNPDLVVVTTALVPSDAAKVRARQDGAAHGPPH